MIKQFLAGYGLLSFLFLGVAFAADMSPVSATTVVSPAGVASVANDALHFRIAGYQVTGNSLLGTERLKTVVKPYTGDGKDFATIQQAVAAIYDAYNAAGYQTVKVVIPEQEMKDGIVRLQVIESRLTTVVVQGNRFFSTRNILNSIPAARKGMVPNSNDISENLRIANENFAKQTQVTFRPGDKEGEVEGVARVTDKESGRFITMLDNTGTTETGRARLGVVYQNTNVMDRDHQAMVMYQTSPQHLSRVKVFSAQYRIPLYDWDSYLDFGGGYSSVNSGTINTAAGNYSVAGSGRNYNLRLTRLLPRIATYDQRLGFGFDSRRFNNDVKFAGTSMSLVPSIEVHPLSLVYQGALRDAGQSWDVTVSYVKNRPYGTLGNAAAFSQPFQRYRANPYYSLWRLGVNYGYVFASEWATRIQFSGQQTRDALVPGEQFGAGGVESVRGFNEREQSNDIGRRASMEILTPGKSGPEGGWLTGAKGAVFYDWATLKRNLPLPGEAVTSTLSSAGVGLRFALGKQGSAKLDAAQVIKGDGVRKSGSRMIHAALIYAF